MRRVNFSIDWRAGAWAGLIAGLADELLVTLLTLAQGIPTGVPARMTAAMLQGPGVLPPPDTMTAWILTAATSVHFGLSIIYGVIAAALLRRVSGWWRAVIVGVALGIGIWFVNYYIVAPLAFPWMVPLRSLPAIPFHHAVFGVVAAAVFTTLRADNRRSGADRRRAPYTVVAVERRARMGDRRHEDFV